MDVRETAYFYLGFKPRTRAQVVKYLNERGFEAEEIEETVRELEEYHYIDDFQFAVMFAEISLEKGRGEKRIRRELAEKGVVSNVIDAAFFDLKAEERMPDPYEQALEIARQTVMNIAPARTWEDKQKIQGKVARKLLSRGFSDDVVYRVVKEVTK